MRKYYLASHGGLAEGMLSSLELIAGDTKNIKALGLEKGDHPDRLAQIVEADINESGNEVEFIIFTDILGGSVNTAMTKLCTYKNVSLISGMNLGMVLEFILAGAFLTVEEAGEGAIYVGKSGITFLNEDKLLENIKNEGDEGLW